VANQLNKTPANTLTAVLTGLAPESQVLKFVNNNYDIEYFDGSAWVEQDFATPGNMVVNPGDGFFVFNSDTVNATVTFVGEVPQGDVSVPLASNFSLISSKVPQALPLTLANGFPQIAEAQYLSWNETTQNYDAIVYNDGTKWVDQSFVTEVPAPVPRVGQGFFFFNPEANTTWVRNFSVN
jgi:hypothetical protein